MLGNVAQNIASVYWTEAPLSLYGLLLFIVMFLFLSYFFMVLVASIWFRDLRYFYPADSIEQRSFLFRLPSGKLTHAQLMVVCSLVNVAGAMSGWYSTPPERTPPLLQAIFQSVPIVTAIPLSKLMLGDRKRYMALKPVLAMLLIAAGILVSLLPSISDISSLGYDTVAWAGVNLFAQVPTGAAMVFQQLFFIRSGVVREGVLGRDKLRIIVRFLMLNQVFILAWVGMLFWLDILSWFGTSDSLATFRTGASFSFQCSLFGQAGIKDVPPGISPSDCAPNTPLYVAMFFVAYVLMLVGFSLLNAESAVFNTVCYVLNTALVSAFWLIPGTNPNPTGTPMWSVLTSLVLSLAGVVLFKMWEMEMPLSEQFDIVSDEEQHDAAGHKDEHDGGSSSDAEDDDARMERKRLRIHAPGTRGASTVPDALARVAETLEEGQEHEVNIDSSSPLLERRNVPASIKHVARAGSIQ